MEHTTLKDVGCRFYTPVEISDGIANHAGKKDLIVDLFSGGGNLYKAFVRKGYAAKTLAFDINHSILRENDCNEEVVNKIVDCLNPDEVRDELNCHSNLSIAFILNPPFKRISIKQELFYWKRFNGYQPRIFTQRIECIAIAAAIHAAPKDSVFYVILPEIVLESQQTSLFFEALKVYYSMSLVKTYKRAQFSSARVDVAVIMLIKQSGECITKVLERQVANDQCITPSPNCHKKMVDQEFQLFRGRVREVSERKLQVSVKDIKIGGVNIIGNKIETDLFKTKETNYSIRGDILIARVGQRMIGRVGIIASNCAITNESIVTIRILDERIRMFVYDALKTSSFMDWCKASARGTANYFLTNRDLKNYISYLIKDIK